MGTHRSISASGSGSHGHSRPVTPIVAKSTRRIAPKGRDRSARRPADHSFWRFPIRNEGGSVWSSATYSRSSVYEGAVLWTAYAGGFGLFPPSMWTVRCSMSTENPSLRRRAPSPPAWSGATSRARRSRPRASRTAASRSARSTSAVPRPWTASVPASRYPPIGSGSSAGQSSTDPTREDPRSAARTTPRAS